MGDNSINGTIFVIPAKAEIQRHTTKESWMPACAGMTWAFAVNRIRL